MLLQAEANTSLMASTKQSGKLAVILHADIAGSTMLVQQDEHLAHDRIQSSFRRLGNLVTKYHGQVCELRAILVEFDRASDAVTAAARDRRSAETHYHAKMIALRNSTCPSMWFDEVA